MPSENQKSPFGVIDYKDVWEKKEKSQNKIQEEALDLSSEKKIEKKGFIVFKNFDKKAKIEILVFLFFSVLFLYFLISSIVGLSGPSVNNNPIEASPLDIIK